MLLVLEALFLLIWDYLQVSVYVICSVIYINKYLVLCVEL